MLLWVIIPAVAWWVVVEAEFIIGLVAHVRVPDQDAIEQAVLARRKQELLAKLGTGEGPKLVTEDVEMPAPSMLPPSW